MKQTFIVYCRTSPACHRYIGYTKLTLMERWAQTLRDTKNGHTPLANAIRKYGTDTWQHEVLFETDDEQLAKDAECVYISLLGYYNIAKGGTGGNTGRNSDPDKRARQSKSLAKHWAKITTS